MNAHEKDTAAIESDIEQTRSRIDDTISALERKLSPGQLLDEGIDYLRRSGTGEFASNLGDTVKHNPVPVALLGLSVGWLMMSNGAGAAPGRRFRGKSDEVAGKAGDAMDRARDKARGARERIRDAAGETRERLGRVSGSARAFGDRTSDNARRAADRVTDFMQEQPLVMGALGIAFGAMLGAGLPATRREDEAMGAARDDLVERAAEAGRERAEKFRSAAHAAKDAARHEADRQGVTSPGAPGA